MKTEVVKASKGIRKAVKILKLGGIVAFPTETVYGLGAYAFDKEAVKKIFKAKSRPGDDPLIVHIGDVREVTKLVKEIPNKARILMKKFWPGPLTIVLKKSSKVPKEVTAGLETVAIRMPSNEIALELCKKVGPIAAPSANRFGKPSPTKAEHVYEDLKGKIPLILDGGSTDIGLESTIVSLVARPRLLRPGKITLEQLRKDLPDLEVMAELKKYERPSAPGMKYKHYAPSKPVILIMNTEKIMGVIDDYKKKGKKVGLIGIKQPKIDAHIKVIFGKNTNKLAKRLFHLLRWLDKQNVDVIIVEGFDEKGIGLAIMNRLRRAASKII